MFDQTFSPENLKHIFYIENRKGRNLFKAFNDLILNSLLEEKQHLRKERNSITKSFYGKLIDEDEFKKKLGDNRKMLNANDRSIDERLLDVFSVDEDIANFIKAQNDVFGQKTDLNGKQIYFLKKNNALLSLILKKIQHDLKKLFKIVFGNRNDIVSQIKTILKFKFPKYVYRYDIAGFYESIDQGILFSKIEKNRRITNSTKQFIFELFCMLKKECGLISGIPRGIGLSAFLSEIYMQDFDKNMKKIDEVLYYARYVDDIIIIARCEKGLKNIENIVAEELKKLKLNLSLEEEKMSYHEHAKNLSYNFTFLGYKFLWNGGTLNIEMSLSRLNRYKEKVKKLIVCYGKDLKQNGKHSEKNARKKLFKRLKFLTSNTRLSNSKSNAMVGIYYSNSHLTNPEKILRGLDCYTLGMFKRNRLLNNDNTRLRFENISFTSGFVNRRFVKFDKNILHNIHLSK